MKPTVLFFLAAFSLAAAAQADGTRIRMAGSSTVYPFVTLAAEEFGRGGGFKTPVVEATGTGGGFKLFCAGAGPDTPDFANASRPIKPSERELCHKNGVKDWLEIAIGYDGIVLAGAVGRPPVALTVPQLFLALVKQVPVNGKLIPNPYKNWAEIAPGLPNTPIEVYGPPPTSGTRDAFVDLVMEKGCASMPEYKALVPDTDARKKACAVIREDGKFVEAGEDDNIIVQKLQVNPDAYGLFGFSFFIENADKVQAVRINNLLPTLADISDGTYPIARSLYVYTKLAHIGKTPGITEFLEELTSERAMGEEGYMTLAGLVPLPDAARREMAARIPVK